MKTEKANDHKWIAPGAEVRSGVPSHRGARVSDNRKKGNGTPHSALQARKQPRQTRSRQMVEAILQAAAEVFADRGYARATTNRIAERAGVSVGSLYQYFPNKDSLLVELLEQHHSDVRGVVGHALMRLADPATPLEEGLRDLLNELVALHRADPALTRALSAAVLRQSPVADEVHKHDGAHDVQRVASVLDRRTDVRAGNRLAMALVLSQTAAQLSRWLVHDAPSTTAPDVLLEEVVLLISRYLVEPDAPNRA